MAIFGVKAGIDRNERRRQDSFAKEILEKVGDAERSAESVGSIRIAEVVSEYTIAYKT